MKRRLALTLPLVVALAAAPAARAATATATLTVNANVVASCLIAPQTLSFLNYDGTVNLSTADITVTCNTVVSHWIGIDNGASGVREMVNGPNVLAYELFRDAARLVTWDAADPGAGPYTINAAGSVQTVYGRVPAGQVVPMGAYSQNLTMTVNF